RAASSRSSASSGVSVEESRSAPGRSSGVEGWFDHSPSRSGSPQGVRGATYFWASPGSTLRQSAATTIATKRRFTEDELLTLPPPFVSKRSRYHRLKDRSLTWISGSRSAARSQSLAVPPEASGRHDPPAVLLCTSYTRSSLLPRRHA